MNFYLFRLICDLQKPSNSYFKKVLSKFEGDNSINTFKNIHFDVFEKKLNDLYFFMYIRYGDDSTYSPDVLNMIKKSVEKNPRERTQIELPNELFVVYIFKTNDLLISDKNKKGLVKYILTAKENMDIIIKNKIIPYDEFINKVKVLNEVRLGLDKNLFNDNDDFKNQITNILGFGDCDYINIKIELNRNFGADLRRRLDFYHNKMNDSSLKSMVCIGEDDNAITSIFNSSNITEKVYVEVDEDENGFHNFKQVLSKLKEIYKF